MVLFGKVSHTFQAVGPTHECNNVRRQKRYILVTKMSIQLSVLPKRFYSLEGRLAHEELYVLLFGSFGSTRLDSFGEAVIIPLEKFIIFCLDISSLSFGWLGIFQSESRFRGSM